MCPVLSISHAAQGKGEGWPAALTAGAASVLNPPQAASSNPDLPISRELGHIGFPAGESRETLSAEG